MLEPHRLQTKADSAIESAATAKDNASEAKSAATEASKTASAAKAETEQARKDIDNLSLNLTTVTETIEANYAKKTVEEISAAFFEICDCNFASDSVSSVFFA